MLVIKGWVHTCIAGVQATWYFLYPHATPSSPVFGAVKRASTTSFGSICFGSFLVALIRTIRYFLNIAQQQARNSNNVAAECALCLVDCILGCLESLINYINQYAFAICAIYGKSFIPAAQQAWGLMKSRGFDAVINDSSVADGERETEGAKRHVCGVGGWSLDPSGGSVAHLALVALSFSLSCPCPS